MKRLIIFILILILAAPVIVEAGRVRGYFRDSDGDGYKDKYVQPYYRTPPDGNPYNNYSHPGNYNPNTGKITPGTPNYGPNYTPRRGYRY